MQGMTNKDAGADPGRINDDVLYLRRWATGLTQELPATPHGPLTIGSGQSSWLRLEDEQGRVSRKHATLSREGAHWVLRDAGSTNGTKTDGTKCSEGVGVELEPGMVIWLGGVTLVAESAQSVMLRAFLGRMLGWGDDRMQTVDFALRSIRTARKRLAALVLCDEDGGPRSRAPHLVLLAHALHRRVLGPESPFVACDPRRSRADKTVRAVENYPSGIEALRAAKHGSLCIWNTSPPRDYEEMMLAWKHPDTQVQLIVCAKEQRDADAFGVFPITVPPLSSRLGDLPRIIEEYAHEITSALGLPRANFPRNDQAWIAEHAATTLPEIEKTILRILRLREVDGNLPAAAELLGMTRSALEKWIKSRTPPVPKDDKKKK